jgi:hypothetical protein
LSRLSRNEDERRYTQQKNKIKNQAKRLDARFILIVAVVVVVVVKKEENVRNLITIGSAGCACVCVVMVVVLLDLQ